jgi:serine/threonine-protein kinase
VTPATPRGLRLSPVPVERFDEYVVVARLGHGGMAEVILGLAQGLQGFRKLVAIKRLHAHCEEDPELVKMFVHEASLAALLQHPNVVQTHKVGQAQGRHFIAMEYLEGQPLQRALPRLCTGRAGLDPLLAARITSDVLAGLAHAHDARDYAGTPLGLVHRDVSPQNLFVTYDGQVKLLDFGIAKAASAGLSSQTRPGLIKGKLSYIAPEQARGAVDRRADLWSVGVVLWEALSGRRLFRGDDEVAVLRAVLSAEVPPIRVFCPDVPEALAHVAARALRRDRDERYSSALEMKHEVDTWLATQDSRQGRVALGQVMQARFAEAILERRAAVLECFAAVDHEESWQATARAEAEALHTSMPSLELGSSERRQGVKRAALAGALLLGGALAVGAVSTVGLDALLARTSVRLDPGQKSGAVEAGPSEAGMVAFGLGAATSAAEPIAEPLPSALSERPQAPIPRRAEALAEPGPIGANLAAQAPSEAAPVLPQLPRRRPHAHASESALATAPVEARERKVLAVAAPDRAALGGVEPIAQVQASGRLRLEATPYAVVSLDGKRLGITPIDVELPAATHTLTLRNPERGIDTTYRVQVVAGESVLRRVELE